MRGCLANQGDLDTEWNNFIGETVWIVTVRVSMCLAWRVPVGTAFVCGTEDASYLSAEIFIFLSVALLGGNTDLLPCDPPHVCIKTILQSK